MVKKNKVVEGLKRDLSNVKYSLTLKERECADYKKRLDAVVQEYSLYKTLSETLLKRSDDEIKYLRGLVASKFTVEHHLKRKDGNVEIEEYREGVLS